MSDLTIGTALRFRPELPAINPDARIGPHEPGVEPLSTTAPHRSSQADALERLRGRGNELNRLINQPDVRSRTPVAVTAHLFANEAQSVLASLSPWFQTLSTADMSLAQLMADVQQACVQSRGIAPLASDPPSFEDILDGLQDLIGTIRDDYLDIYARLVEKFSSLYADFNSQILAQMEKWISAVGDQGEINLNCAALGNALQGLIDKYSYPNDAAVLFPEPGQGASKEDAEKWLKAMGLPASCLVNKGDGTYCVVLDLAPLKQMKNSLPGSGWVKMSAAKFQAWQSGFNALQQEVESALQKHTQKYSNANSIHDNVQKTISSTLSSLFDMLKAFASALG